jgi:hypothetical protein
VGGVPSCESVEFNFDLEDFPFNITAGFSTLTHGVNFDSSYLEGGNNLEEIVTSYGVFRLELSALHPHDLVLIWENPKQDTTVVPADVGQSGYDDLLMIETNFLWYIDDLFENQQPEVTVFKTDCSIVGTLKVNQTFEVTAEVTDEEDNDVQANIIIYADEAFEQSSGWFPLQSSGTVFTSSFYLNETTPGSTIRVLTRDGISELPENVLERTMTVGFSGCEFGDSEYIEIIDVTPDEEECETDDDCLSGYTCVSGVCIADTEPSPSNALSDGIGELNEIWGLGTTIIWLIIMGAVGWSIFRYGHENSPTFTIGAFLIVETILFIMGAYLQFFTTALVVIVAVLASIPVGLVIARIVSGFRSG